MSEFTPLAGAMLAAQARATVSDTARFHELKRAAIRYFLDVIVPEAAGLEAAPLAGASGLYACSDEAFASC